MALAEISLGPSGVLSAIEEQRNAVVVHLLGQGDAFTLRIEDPAEAAQITDAAIASFRAELVRGATAGRPGRAAPPVSRAW